MVNLMWQIVLFIAVSTIPLTKYYQEKSKMPQKRKYHQNTSSFFWMLYASLLFFLTAIFGIVESFSDIATFWEFTLAISIILFIAAVGLFMVEKKIAKNNFARSKKRK